LSDLIDTVLEIDTPEHLAFRARIAGPGRRMFAWLIDLLVRGGIAIGLAISSQIIFGSVALEGVAMGITLLVLFALDWGYFFICELITGGRSPGKMALKLRVVRPNGLPITWRESFLRNLVRAADLALFPPYFLFLGPMVMALDSKFRRLGDLVAGTIVVVEETSRVTSKSSIEPDSQIVESLPARLPLDREDLEAIELFVDREHMSEARREELARIVSPAYIKRLAIDEPQSAAKMLASLWARAQDPGRTSGDAVGQAREKREPTRGSSQKEPVREER
jgi:uncharacterized RDD family membrane protein YckC